MKNPLNIPFRTERAIIKIWYGCFYLWWPNTPRRSADRPVLVENHTRRCQTSRQPRTCTGTPPPSPTSPISNQLNRNDSFIIKLVPWHFYSEEIVVHKNCNTYNYIYIYNNNQVYARFLECPVTVPGPWPSWSSHFQPGPRLTRVPMGGMLGYLSWHSASSASSMISSIVLNSSPGFVAIS